MHLVALSLLSGVLGLLCLSARNSESLLVAGGEEGGSWELVWLLPLPVPGVFMAREGLCATIKGIET